MSNGYQTGDSSRKNFLGKIGQIALIGALSAVGGVVGGNSFSSEPALADPQTSRQIAEIHQVLNNQSQKLIDLEQDSKDTSKELRELRSQLKSLEKKLERK